MDNECIPSSIFGRESENGKELCVNYLKRTDVCEKRIVF